MNNKSIHKTLLLGIKDSQYKLIILVVLLVCALLSTSSSLFAWDQTIQVNMSATKDLNNQPELTPISTTESAVEPAPTSVPNTSDQTQSPDASDTATWQQLTTPSSPSARAQMGFVYDSCRHVIVAIGGSNGSTKFTETWEFDGSTWTRKSTAHFPGGRNRPAIAFDPVRCVSIIFGGSTPGDTTFFNDTWEYDGIDWKLKLPANPPSPRNGATMVYNPARGRIFLFGGYRYERGYVFFNETWEYDGIQWQQLFPTNRPAERETAGIVYDTNRNRVILFGGGRAAGSTVFNDTWAWDGTNWTQLVPAASPPARWAHAMTNDQTRNRIILFGGLTGTTSAFNDTWEFDGNTWTAISVSPVPPKRWDHGMVYDSEHNATVLFGGVYYDFGYQWKNDTWKYNAALPAPQRPVIFLPGYAGSKLRMIPPLAPACRAWTADADLWLNVPELYFSQTDGHLLYLSLQKDGFTPKYPCPINAYDLLANIDDNILWKEIKRDFYDKILANFAENQYIVERCPYDWRLFLDKMIPDASILDTIDKCVKNTLNRYNVQQVDIVAHSTGGLAARQYVLSSPERAATVNTIVTMGTPYLGLLKTFMMLRYGVTLIDDLDPIIDDDDIQAVALHAPTTYYLLPSASFFNARKGYFSRSDGNGSTDYTDYNSMRDFLAGDYNGDLVAAAYKFHIGFIDNWQGDGLDNIHYYVFVGDGVSTTIWVGEYIEQQWGGLTSALKYNIVNSTRGDGTVPLISATLHNGKQAGKAKICTYNRVEHGALPNDPGVWNDLNRALRQGITGSCGSSGQVGTGFAEAAVANTSGDNIQQIVVDGPGLVHILDNQGRHTGPISATLPIIENNIPLATYLADDKVTFVSLPPISTYTVTVEMSDTVPLDIKLRTIVEADRPEEAITQTVSFQNISSALGGRATIAYNPLATPDTLRLMVDLNGDGVYEQTLSPTAILNMQESADRQSPVTNIQVQGQKDADGFFTGTVNATLTATDTGSGVQRIEYSVDGGKTGNQYTGPFSVVAESVPTLYAQAFDRAGNSEYPLASVVLRPSGNITPGDCNGDQSITASDITALAFEFFDGDDNNNPAATSGGSYPGSPGCDANGDTHIGASDINCMARIFFNGAGTCGGVTMTSASASPVLSIPSQLTVAPTGQVTVPLRLQTNASAVGSLLFALDYDETHLSFDPADNNQDGIPDAISFNLPAQYMGSVVFDQADAAGELDIMIANFAASPVPLTDGALLSVTLTAGNPVTSTLAAVKFSQAPATSFGDTQGQDVTGVTADGAVLITTELPAEPSTIYLPIISAEQR